MKEVTNNKAPINQFDKMTKTPVPKLIIQLGIPTIISMLITNVYNTADTYFVNKIGTSAGGAVGIVFSLMAILQAVGFMFGHGAGSIISRKLGEKDKETASKIASTSFFLSVFSGIVIGILGLLLLTPFMKLLGSTDTILPYARQYGFFILLAAPFMMASCVLNNILRYEGKAAYAMIGLTIGGVLNMAGDPFFMFVLKLDVIGAGLSTAISQAVSFLILLYIFLRGKTESKISLKLFSRKVSDTIDIVKNGFPSLIRQGMGSISTMLLNHQAAFYGDTAVNAMSIVNRISMLVFSVGLGLGQGFQPVAAFNYGAKKYSRVKKGFYFTVTAGEIMLGSFALITMFAAKDVIVIFNKDADVLNVGVLALIWQSIACFFQPLSVCANMMFQSVGESKKATLLASLRSGICYIPLILILPNVIGLLGIQISQAIADIIAFTISAPLSIRFLRSLPNDENK